MKNVFKFSLVLGVALFTMNVHASDVDFSLGVKKENGKMITFAFSDIKQMELTIYDAKNVLIYTEKRNSEEFISRSYDLKDLPEGEYFLVAESALKIATYKISVVGERAELSETPISEEFKPVFIKENGFVKVNFLNLDESATVIKIYDRDDVLVFDSGEMKDQKIAKIFDIYNIENEEYTIALTDNNKTYTKTFSKR
jgi:hypothetical protein